MSQENRAFSIFSLCFERRTLWIVPMALGVMLYGLGVANSARAASQTWIGGGNDGLWTNGANWSGGAAPGLVTTVNNDVATFNGAVGMVSPIIFDNQRNLASFLFDTANAGAY